MPISDKTRKILWGKAANRCAICKCSLVIEKKENDNESIVGDECHIVAQSKGGPRYDIDFPTDQLDEYYNLILLCKVHHKMVDDQCQAYTTKILREFKQTHENWVTEKLNSHKKNINNEEPEFLFYITSGKYFYNIIHGSQAFSYDFDETDDNEKMDKIKVFIQKVQDYVDIWPDFTEVSQSLEAMEYLKNALDEIEKIGYMVFAGKDFKTYIDNMGNKFRLSVTVVKILYAKNPEIICVKL